MNSHTIPLSPTLLIQSSITSLSMSRSPPPLTAGAARASPLSFGLIDRDTGLGRRGSSTLLLVGGDDLRPGSAATADAMLTGGATGTVSGATALGWQQRFLRRCF
eukprot:CAMPEP_0114546502 /NCGR_PEP_ID=MMETSP0114-20121206/3968_1 /TAXON_ID=31324 /ORGANISM="Goniomonas sp, Strain m" /LENGTH=104 /DNA_ID=CAMNT_0001731001 /DNA_START=283 /DNA_END=594 /DNA_ORIENTATION=+